MSRKRHSTEQIITKLREAEVLTSQGCMVPEICRQLGVSANIYYRWRKEDNGFRPHSSLDNLTPEDYAFKHEEEGT